MQQACRRDYDCEALCCQKHFITRCNSKCDAFFQNVRATVLTTVTHRVISGVTHFTTRCFSKCDAFFSQCDASTTKGRWTTTSTWTFPRAGNRPRAQRSAGEPLPRRPASKPGMSRPTPRRPRSLGRCRASSSWRTRTSGRRRLRRTAGERADGQTRRAGRRLERVSNSEGEFCLLRNRCNSEALYQMGHLAQGVER